jgi:hypothetical protein
MKCEENPKEMLIIQKELFLLASKGDLLIENDVFVRILADRL